MNKLNSIGILFAVSLVFMLGSLHFTSAADATVCCEKTTNGLYCQNVPAGECSSSSRQVPTSCSSTSFCNPGVCFDSSEGTCAENTPQVVCNANNGVWSAVSPPQCSLGCCILGDQAAFVTLTRCKALSSQLGLKTNYDKTITDETACVLSVKGQEDGACVYQTDYQTTCKRTTRANCGSIANDTNVGGTFYAGKLCSDEKLGTNCGLTTKTSCSPGKDGVYFVDSCGNIANIYDSSKINDKQYWSDIIDSSQACNAGKSNANSASCGNCNYLAGSYCRDSANAGAKASYGDYICADLNCAKTSNGKSYKHGESWCVNTDSGKTGQGSNSVGSRAYLHICENGQEVVEPCADFRQEMCIQSSLNTTSGTFSQAACRVNRWQDCTAQDNQQDCQNSDKRDCLWKAGVSIISNDSTGTTVSGACVPMDSPGLEFWSGDDAKSVCAQGNAQCVVTFEKGLLGGGMKCTKNCDCLTPQWQAQHSAICTALGDCGPKVNWVGSAGYKVGYNFTITSV
jgi:hypothetical protein